MYSLSNYKESTIVKIPCNHPSFIVFPNRIYFASMRLLKLSKSITGASISTQVYRGSGDMYLDIAPYIIKKRTPLNILS